MSFRNLSRVGPASQTEGNGDWPQSQEEQAPSASFGLPCGTQVHDHAPSLVWEAHAVGHSSHGQGHLSGLDAQGQLLLSLLSQGKLLFI